MTRSRILISVFCATALLGFLSACTSSVTEEAVGNASLSGDLPEAISVVQHLDASASTCNSDGIQIVYGLDHNHDGKLSPYERRGRNVVCAPGTVVDGPAVATLPEKKQTPANRAGG